MECRGGWCGYNQIRTHGVWISYYTNELFIDIELFELLMGYGGVTLLFIIYQFLSWRSVLLVEEVRVLLNKTNYLPQVTKIHITLLCIVLSSPWIHFFIDIKGLYYLLIYRKGDRVIQWFMLRVIGIKHWELNKTIILLVHSLLVSSVFFVLLSINQFVLALHCVLSNYVSHLIYSRCGRVV